MAVDMNIHNRMVLDCCSKLEKIASKRKCYISDESALRVETKVRKSLILFIYIEKITLKLVNTFPIP